MPVLTDDSGQAALENVRESVDELAGLGARETDIAFLKELMDSNVITSLVAAHDRLEDSHLEPVSADNIELVKEVLEELENKRSKQAKELQKILSNPHFRAMVEAHDDVAAKNYEAPQDSFVLAAPPPPVIMGPPSDAIRMVGIRKTAEEPLGITVKSDDRGNLLIARILTGGLVDSQGLLHIGDIIKEVNGQEVTTPDQLQEYMKKAQGSVTLKIMPSYVDNNILSQVYIRTHFGYDPAKDNLIPCKDAGLKFKEGDILQILNMDDANWWQARKVDDNEPAGLVPSQTLEEKRKAFVKPEYDYTKSSLLCGIKTKKKKKYFYQSKANSEFDRHDLMVYEEVARMPPFQRKTLVLVGGQGVGRRTLKKRLIESDPSRFGETIPHTSRAMRQDEIDGDGYYYITKEMIDRDIADGKYLEHGEFEGELYGTKFDTIRAVMRSGRMCIMDCNAQALKLLKTSEFMPYVVFVAAPKVETMRNMHEFAKKKGLTHRVLTERDFRNTLEESMRLERNYKQYFDLTIVNDNMDECYNTLRKAIETLSTEPQWVPVSWVY